MISCPCTDPPTECVGIYSRSHNATVAWGCPKCVAVQPRSGYGALHAWAEIVWKKECSARRAEAKRAGKKGAR